MIKNYISIFTVLLSFTAFAQVTYNGNGNTGFGGTIGQSTLQVNDNGTTISFTLTKGTSGTFGNALVLYLDTQTGGRNVIDADVNDNGDGLRTAISNGDSSGFASTLTFPSGFGADYVIGINQFFAGFWEIPATGVIGNNGLVYQDTCNLSPTGTDASATYTFDIDWTELGLTNTDSFTIVGYYVSESGYNSDESFNGGVAPGNIAGDAITFSNILEYPSGTTLSTIENTFETLNLYIANNALNINNFKGEAKISAYNILGKQILKPETLIVNGNYKKTLQLPKNQVSFIVFEANGQKRVLKTIIQ